MKTYRYAFSFSARRPPGFQIDSLELNFIVYTILHDIWISFWNNWNSKNLKHLHLSAVLKIEGRQDLANTHFVALKISLSLSNLKSSIYFSLTGAFRVIFILWINKTSNDHCKNNGHYNTTLTQFRAICTNQSTFDIAFALQYVSRSLAWTSWKFIIKIKRINLLKKTEKRQFPKKAILKCEFSSQSLIIACRYTTNPTLFILIFIITHPCNS